MKIKKISMNVSGRTNRRGIVLSGLILAAVAGVSSAAGERKLFFNGKVASTDVRILNGAAYVKLSDMAKALDMIMVKRDDDYVLIKQGGANQIKGAVEGKIGDVLFDGRWRFQVIKMETPASYTMKTDADTYDSAGLTKFDRTTHVVTPGRGRTLVVLHCRVINGVKEKRTLWTAISDDRIHTALTDQEGSSHAPVGYDFEGAPIQSKWLLPGAAMNFPVIFSVPEGTALKDLIFTLKNNQNTDPPTDVRVSLQ